MYRGLVVFPIFGVLLCFGAVAWGGDTAPLPPKETAIQMQLGDVGGTRAGLNLTLKDYREILGGHYYEGLHPVDVPLTGTVNGEDVTLSAANGAVFALHFIANSADVVHPLGFYTAIGLVGTCIRNGQTLPVRFEFEWFMNADSVPAPGHWYRDGGVTDEADADFETRVQTFLAGIIDGDPEKTAASGTWPIVVSGKGLKKPLTLHNKAQLMAHWKTINTPAFVARAKLAVPHEMFVHNGAAMVVNSDIWFGPGRGAHIYLFK